MATQSKPIRSDDPQALEKLMSRLSQLEAASPRNSSAISETKKRIRQLQRIERMEHEVGWFPGGQYQTNEQTNRICFVFDQQPDQETIEELNRLGFRGAKASLCYQSPRTPKYIRRARRLAEQLREPFPSNLSRKEQATLLVYAKVLLDALSDDAPVELNQYEHPSEVSIAEMIAARFADLDGVTTTIKGAQTDSPVIWLSGDTDAHKELIEARGGRWSSKRSAWYANSRTIKESNLEAKRK